MKQCRFILIFIFFSTAIWSQELKVGVQSGLEFSNMLELRQLNQQFESKLPFDTKLVADFPAYWYYQPMISITYKKIGIGLEYSYNSTGSRISGRDYSGEYELDMRISRRSPGIFIDYSFFSHKNVSFKLCSRGGMIFTSLGMKENLVINDISSTNNSYDFKSKNYYINNEFIVAYSLWQTLEFEFNFGYLIQVGKGTFYNAEDKNQVLANMSTGIPIKPGWNGLMFGITINYTLIKFKKIID